MATYEGYRPYGGKVEDFLADVDAVGAAGEDVFTPGGGTTVTVWDDPTDGEQVTDLLDDSGAAITEVGADEMGALPRFHAPDSYTELWVDAGGGRRQMLPADLGTIPLEAAGEDAVTSVNDKVGSVELTFSDVGAAAETHTHTIAQVTSLQSALDGKVDAATAHASNPGGSALRTVDLGYALASSNPDLEQVTVDGKDGAVRNEWGAIRGTSPYSWGDALVRAIREDDDGITDGRSHELIDRRTAAPSSPGNVMWGRRWTDGALIRNGIVMSDVLVKQTSEDVDPRTPTGTVVVNVPDA